MALATMPGGASLTEKRWAELSQYAPWKKIIHSSAQQLTQEKAHARETHVSRILGQGTLKEARRDTPMSKERAASSKTSRKRRSLPNLFMSKERAGVFFYKAGRQSWLSYILEPDLFFQKFFKTKEKP
jgi:hypothetical protein